MCRTGGGTKVRTNCGDVAVFRRVHDVTDQVQAGDLRGGDDATTGSVKAPISDSRCNTSHNW